MIQFITRRDISCQPGMSARTDKDFLWRQNTRTSILEKKSLKPKVIKYPLHTKSLLERGNLLVVQKVKCFETWIYSKRINRLLKNCFVIYELENKCFLSV